MPAALLAAHRTRFLDQRSGGARRQCSGSRVYSFRLRALAGLARLGHAVSAVQTVPALLEYFSYGGGPAAYAALFLAGQAAQLGLLACLFFLPGAKRYFSVCGRNGKNAE